MLLVDVRPPGYVRGGEIRDRLSERREAVDVLFDELPVVEFFVDDDVDDPGQDRSVFAGARLKVYRGPRGGLRPAWVDDNQLHAAVDRRFQTLAGILTGDADRLGHQGIGADQQPAVGFVEVDITTQPVAVGRERDLFPGLVDRVGGEEHRRTDGADERIGHQRGRRIGQSVGPQVQRHRAGSEFCDQSLQGCRDLIHRLPGLDGCIPAADGPFLAVQQPVGIVVNVGKRPALGAGVTLE